MLGFDITGSGDGHVIVLNDWLSDTSTWNGVRPYLDQERRTWVFADLRGYGRSREIGGDFTLREAASDVIALADRLGWSSFSIIGHSMSSLVALYLAQTYPGHIERVILVTPSPPQSFRFDDDTIQHLQAAALGDDDVRLELLRGMQGGRLVEQWVRFKLDNWRNTSRPEAVAAYTLMWAKEGLPDMSIRISAPLLAITGEDDREDMRSAAMLAALKPLSEAAQTAPLVNCGHCPMQEMPPLFATIVDRFLANGTAPAC